MKSSLWRSAFTFHQNRLCYWHPDWKGERANRNWAEMAGNSSPTSLTGGLERGREGCSTVNAGWLRLLQGYNKLRASSGLGNRSREQSGPRAPREPTTHSTWESEPQREGEPVSVTEGQVHSALCIWCGWADVIELFVAEAFREKAGSRTAGTHCWEVNPRTVGHQCNIDADSALWVHTVERLELGQFGF